MDVAKRRLPEVSPDSTSDCLIVINRDAIAAAMDMSVVPDEPLLDA